MKRLLCAALLPAFAMLSLSVFAGIQEKVVLGGGEDYVGHVQGVCTDGTNLYWSMTYDLVKTDANGRELAKFTAKGSHMGDLCYHAGRVYVGINRMAVNGVRRGDEVWVFDPEGLERVAVHPTPQTVWCNNGIEWCSNRFWVVSNAPRQSQYNYVFEYTEDFRFVQCRPIDSGPTVVGVQTICLWGDKMLFGTYGGVPTFAVDVKDLTSPSKSIESPAILPVAAKADAMTAEGMFVVGGGIWTAHGKCRWLSEEAKAKDQRQHRRFGAFAFHDRNLERKLAQ